ncbi:LysR family transcriptional regulator [Paraburkholderia sp. SIMBA_053]|uniref:helix-turn-helix domain-containing protein n=1 Tax=Paraburkholderia sp. SIMBA_053 TaxID=3085794 RepID=UPI00397B653F
MDRLDALKVFIRIVERGTFAAAAPEIGIGQPAVSKQIASLERNFGAQLVRRTSRRIDDSIATAVRASTTGT